MHVTKIMHLYNRAVEGLLTWQTTTEAAFVLQKEILKSCFISKLNAAIFTV